MRGVFAFLFALLCYIGAISKTKEELVYPVIPIRDDCHFVFDDTTSVRVVKRDAFLELDRLWHTEDFCFAQKMDTTFYAEFEVVFEDVLGQAYGWFGIHDGHLQSEYQSALNDARRLVKSFSKVHIQNAKFENNGALHQVPNFTLVIDSIVEAEYDLCFSLFSIPYQNEVLLSKDSILRLFKDKFCVNSCTQKRYWPDTASSVQVTLAPFDTRSNSYTYTRLLPSFVIDSYPLTDEDIGIFSQLKSKALVQVEPMIYRKGGSYLKVKGWRFKIID